MGETRVEKDSMGEVEVPASAYYGAQTQRAADNFPISGWRFGRRFIQALGLVKWAAAQANEDLGDIEDPQRTLGRLADEGDARGDLRHRLPRLRGAATCAQSIERTGRVQVLLKCGLPLMIVSRSPGGRESALRG